MGRTIQLIRGTTAQNDSFTGGGGVLTVDSEKNCLRLHDGVTPGGHEILNLYSFLNFFAPDYNSGVLLGSADSNHTVSEYGYIQFVGSGITNGYAIGYINDIQVSKMGSSGFQNGEKAGFYFVIPGDTARIDKGSVYFYKLRGLS